MENKKRVTILATIALVLAITAITLNIMDSSSEIPTTKAQSSPTGAVVGVTIEEPLVEDKLAMEEVNE